MLEGKNPEINQYLPNACQMMDEVQTYEEYCEMICERVVLLELKSKLFKNLC